jgi:hypothetical protein
MIYTIVEKDNMEDLIKTVQSMITAGWRPLGGVFIDRKHWFQTMTRS